MLKVICETENYIAVNKPSGLITEKNIYENSLELEVIRYLEKTKKKPFVGIVHRLDRVTSGVVLFAKKKSVLKYLNLQFEKREIRKTYISISISTKKIEKKKDVLSHFLMVDSKNKKAKIHDKEVNKAKKCILKYKILDIKANMYLVEIKPQTGRFHQIRAQLSYIGMPIFGDEKYGGAKGFCKKEIYLHAWKLKFKDFDSNKTIELVAETPRNTLWKEFDLFKHR